MMTNELLKAWLECLKRDLRCECCVNDECEHCDLLKKQGTLKERIDALDKVIKALEQQPCEDCISRQAVLDNAYAYGNGLELEGYCVNVEDIQALPSITPSRPRGKWIREKRDFLLVYRCSNCKNFIYSRETISDVKYEDLSRVDSHRYCSRCGADMRESEDEE